MKKKIVFIFLFILFVPFLFVAQRNSADVFSRKESIKLRLVQEEIDESIDDYKFMCFNGVADNVMVCTNRKSGYPKFRFFDMDWNLKRYNKSSLNDSPNAYYPKPKKIKEMFLLASKLSEGFPFVRVDLYYANNKIYFGEMTFFPQAGWDPNIVEEADIMLGDKIDIKNVK